MIDLVAIIEETLEAGKEGHGIQDHTEIATKYNLTRAQTLHDGKYEQDPASKKPRFIPSPSPPKLVVVTYMTYQIPLLEDLQRAAKSLADLANAHDVILSGDIEMHIGHTVHPINKVEESNNVVSARLALTGTYAQRYLGLQDNDNGHRDVEVKSVFYRALTNPPIYYVDFSITPNEFRIPEVREAVKIIAGLYGAPAPTPKNVGLN